ncbi:MAG: hypothetical protein FD181_1975 [Prolixibacteraceae bacterium]|nr:MAG: hypothetical protein FD181_1975 [Prolixibacteraceae bacterium]
MALPINDKMQSAESKSGRFFTVFSDEFIALQISGKNKVKSKATDSQIKKNQKSMNL